MGYHERQAKEQRNANIFMVLVSVLLLPFIIIKLIFSAFKRK